MDKLTLPERCDRATVKKLVPQLAEMAGKQPIQIDASQVTLAGQALLQLLLSARHTAKGAIISPSPALIEASQISGLASKLFEGASYDE